MNKIQVTKRVLAFIKDEYKLEEINEDMGLEDCGINDPWAFAFDIARHFDKDGWIDGDELEEGMSVWHVIDFIWELY